MAKKSASEHRDPEVDGPRTFDRHSHRLTMALACRDRPVTWSELGDVSGQSDANGRKSAETLCRWGILRKVRGGTGKPALRLREEWHEPVEEAELRALRGRIASGNVLLLISRKALPSFYRLLADRDGSDPRIAWVTRLPHHASYGLVVLVNPAISEDGLERLTVELSDRGIDHERLALGRMAGQTELREFAAGSLPGAFDHNF
jgi:hypothetical protein